jgi:thiol-disulfide isomerase/thioredoxin
VKNLILSIIIFLTPVFLFSQEIGKEARQFSGKTENGDKINLSDYKGKILVLDFWASWCKPCKEEFPYLIELYNQYSDKNFSILGVNIDKDIANLRKFLLEINKDVPYKIILDPEAKIPSDYNLDSMPSVFIIDKNGVVKYIHIGFLSGDKEKYKKEIETLLSE